MQRIQIHMLYTPHKFILYSNLPLSNRLINELSIPTLQEMNRKSGDLQQIYWSLTSRLVKLALTVLCQQFHKSRL